MVGLTAKPVLASILLAKMIRKWSATCAVALARMANQVLCRCRLATRTSSACPANLTFFDL